MKIEVHAICWNEQRLLPMFLDHYSRFATRIYVWDNFSDDESVDLVRKCDRAVLMSFDSDGRASNRTFQKLKNNCWKWSTADWVIVCDIDELVYHPQVVDYLNSRVDAEVLRCTGYNLVGINCPILYPLSNWKGRYASPYSKAAVFRPRIAEIGYGLGSHKARSSSPVRESALQLFHTHYTGAFDEIVARHNEVEARLCPREHKIGMSRQFCMSVSALRQRYDNMNNGAVPLEAIQRVREMICDGHGIESVSTYLCDRNLRPSQQMRRWDPESLDRVFGYRQIQEFLSFGIWEFAEAGRYHFDPPLADRLSRFFGVRSVIDFGCGAGKYVNVLSRTLDCRGYDANPNTPRLSNNRCEVRNLALPMDVEPSDWILCIEVAEHIPPEHERTFIMNLDRHNRVGIVISWAQPGQGGCGHYNERPPEYVIRLFKELGYQPDHRSAASLRESATLPWLRKNLMVFLRR